MLLAVTAIALGWANSPWAESYHHLWAIPLTIGAPAASLTMPLHDWVNDGLMALFFFLVGLEIKREVLVGELSSRRSATLPVAAALGGMLVPAALFALLNANGAGARGWGIPMATDIAFALGVLALLGRRVPNGLRVFLAALAIADDLGAVLVIAFFYTGALDWAAMGGAAAVLAVLVALNVAGARRPLTYALLGVVLWLFVLKSGIHATIAGVLLALTVPAGRRVDAAASLAHDDVVTHAPSPLERMEHALGGFVAFVVMPVFALANAGVSLRGGTAVAARSPVAWGIVLGLVLGKPIGIMAASWLAVRMRVADLPASAGWRHVHGAAWLGGIGFTMSLFVAGLAFADRALLDVAKLGVLGASVLAGIAGYTILRFATRPSPSGPA